MKSITPHYSVLLVASLFTVASCTTVELPRAYPPAVIKQPPKPRSVVVAKPRPIPEITHPVDKPVVKPAIKPKPRRVIVKAYEPEQGVNPYDNVPNRTSTTRSNTSSGAKGARQAIQKQPEATTSPAVKSLLIQAKAAMLVSRNAAAIEKLERALRIEARNPEIWYQLAKAHYNQKEDAVAISMASKSNHYVAEGSPLEKRNWQLIKAASKRSENIKSLKAAILYERAHP